MYMSLICKPTGKDLEQYPHVLLPSPHEWDPSVLDYAHPNTCGYHSWVPDPPFNTNMTQGLMRVVTSRTVQTLNILSEAHISPVQKHVQKCTNINYNQLKPDFGSANANTIKKPFELLTQWAVESTRFSM